ncbi:tigger transposable element-derived protein 4-like [Aphis craccivora]|uniref:Tigger transposable element-derived protein 4-like n=1 Tax=Aphis craccivora TaxID=307492 RepID=A0A6G0XK71_APHCR|nr:tigger transposable element-derived protein 4-like [Aphis craccivora]KAF0740717.1 tigger transposable element-derived protein 4-like [Aphis craccivora]
MDLRWSVTLKKKSVIIFYDVLCGPQSIIREYFGMCRHSGASSVFYLAQTYSKIPKQLDDTNLKHIFNDHSSAEMDFSDFREISHFCWNHIDYGFMVIDKTREMNEVRIALSSVQLENVKGYTPNWTTEIFTVSKVLHTDPITYQNIDAMVVSVTFFRMSPSQFNELLNMVILSITKNDTNFRKAIPAQDRLAITLRFLATGDSYHSLSYLFKISKQTISKTVREVCKANHGCSKGICKGT